MNVITQPVLPLTSLLNIGATSIVLLFAGLLLTAMFLFIRISTDDSDKYKELKNMVEALFGTPAHLQPGTDVSTDNEAAADSERTKATIQVFSEPCPACEQIVSEQDIHCPSCGLRLL